MSNTPPKTQKTRSEGAQSMVRPLSAREILLVRRWLRLLPVLYAVVVVLLLLLVWMVSDD